MPIKNPKRDEIERILKEHPKRKAYNIAKECGLDKDMGTDRAVEYIRRVRKTMRSRGQLPAVSADIAAEADLLKDITKLFSMRKGRMSKKAAATMLLLNCYYRFCSEDDSIHVTAIDSTYALNAQLENPLPMMEAIGLCDIALARYMASQDEEQNAAAKRKGYPKAGLNYSNDTLIDICEITERELTQLDTIRKA